MRNSSAATMARECSSLRASAGCSPPSWALLWPFSLRSRSVRCVPTRSGCLAARSSSSAWPRFSFLSTAAARPPGDWLRVPRPLKIGSGRRYMSSPAKPAVKTYQNYFNGQWVPSSSGETFPVFDPSTEEVIAHVASSSAADVDKAVKAARAAFDSGAWPATTAQDRGRVLFKLAEKIRQNLPMLAEIECRNTGKPIVEAEYDIGDVATCFEYYGGLANKVTGNVMPVPANALSFTLREPVGVAGQIIPWNYPLLMAAWKLAPALAAGCTCVLKPAEQTPLTALEVAKWFEEVGLPQGVINVITGFGESCGSPLVKHPDVNKIAFTGSASVGKIIVKEAADTVKRVTLELGGKSPNIFFADADFEAAIDGALFGVFINQGEVCSAGSRILVQKSIYKNFVDAMTEKAKKIRLGPPLDRETKMVRWSAKNSMSA